MHYALHLQDRKLAMKLDAINVQEGRNVAYEPNLDPKSLQVRITLLNSIHFVPILFFLQFSFSPTSASMSSSLTAEHPKSQKHRKFGHLPRSTSGPQECALTASPPVSLNCYLCLYSTNFLLPRVPPFSVPHTSTRALAFLPPNETCSSCMAFSHNMFRHWNSKLNVPISNTSLARPTLPKTHSWQVLNNKTKCCSINYFKHT